MRTYTSRPVIYVAGPFRAPTPWQIEQNIREAEFWALEIWKLGGAAICPHGNSRYFHGTVSDEILLDGTMEFLRRSDAILLAPKWYESVGAKAEERLAWQLAMPIFQVDYSATSPGMMALRTWISAWAPKTEPVIL